MIPAVTRLRQGVLAVLLLAGLAAAPAAPAAEPAVAERIDPGHSGSAAAPAPPLRQRWTRELEPEDNSHPEISYPLVVGERVFVVAARRLQALSAQTGEELWSVPLVPAQLAYDGGRLIAAAGSWVKAFDPATGQELWTRELETDDCAPVAKDGVVYTKSTWVAYALNVTNGATLWSRDLQRRSICQATVGTELVYYGGESAFALRRSDGTVAWTHEQSDSSRLPLALHGGRVWQPFTQHSPALDATTGAVSGGAYTQRLPAFAGELALITVGDSEYDPQARMLQAVDAATGAVRWEFGAEHGFTTTPTVAGGTVYVGDMRRGLYGLRASDGRLQWCTTMPEFPDRYTHVVAGEGLLLVAAGHSLTVYEPGGAPGCDYKSVARPHWGDPIEGTTARQAFESDQGQLPPGVRFAAAGAGHELLVTDEGARLTTAGGDVTIRPAGATGPRSTRGEQRLPGLINMISAREQHVRIRRYERVRQRETWPGIDLVYRLSGPALEYDVVVRPGADLQRARIALDGAGDLRVDADGALVARVGSQTVRQAPPVAFQGGRRLPARFVLHGDGTVSFAVTGRDPARTLVIDPVLGVSGFLGGWVEDEITDVDLDAAGNIYVSGWTQSRDLAPFGWDEWNAMCAFDTCVDAFVAKYAPGGRSLVYLTLLSGARDDWADAVAAGASGHAYVAGETESADFPTRNAAQDGFGDAFVAKLAPDGSALEWSTYQGRGRDRAFDLAVDPAGAAYVAGHTYAMEFPTTPSAADRVCSSDISTPQCSEGWVAKYTTAGALVYSTLFGGDDSEEWITGIAVDRAGRAVVAGHAGSASDFPATPGAYDTTPESTLSESFVARLNAAGSAVEWATLLGGFDWDDAEALALDAQDRPVVVGTTESWDFPTTPGAHDRLCTDTGGEIPCTNQSDGFVTKLAADGSALVWSTFLGGTGYDTAQAVDVDARGDVVVTGAASDEFAFPLKDAFQDDEANTSLSCGSRSWCADAYFVRLSENGALLAGTLLGGGSHDVGTGVAAEPDGDAWVAGFAHSRDFPASADAVQTMQAGGNCGASFVDFGECTDGFLAEIRASGSQPQPNSGPGTQPGSSPGTSTGATAGDVAGDAAPSPRRLSVRRRGRVISGRLAGEACTASVRLVLERRARGAWRVARRARTSTDGRFRLRLPSRAGRYRLRAPASAACGPAYAVIRRSTAA